MLWIWNDLFQIRIQLWLFKSSGYRKKFRIRTTIILDPDPVKSSRFTTLVSLMCLTGNNCNWHWIQLALRFRQKEWQMGLSCRIKLGNDCLGLKLVAPPIQQCKILPKHETFKIKIMRTPNEICSVLLSKINKNIKTTFYWCRFLFNYEVVAIPGQFGSRGALPLIYLWILQLVLSSV